MTIRHLFLFTSLALSLGLVLTGCGSGGGGGSGSGTSGGTTTPPPARTAVNWSVQNPDITGAVVGHQVLVSGAAAVLFPVGSTPPTGPITISFTLNGSVLPLTETATFTQAFDTGHQPVPNLFVLQFANHPLFNAASTGTFSLKITFDSTGILDDSPTLGNQRFTTVPIVVAPAGTV